MGVSRRRWVLVVLATVVVGVVIGLAAVGAGDASRPDDTAAAASGAKDGASDGSAGDEADPTEPGRANVTKGGSAKSEVEVVPDGASSADGLPGLKQSTKKRESDKPLIAKPLPEFASARGTWVEGFPTKVVSLPGGATLVSSSVAPSGSALQITLQASTPQGVDAVLAHYRLALTRLGFDEVVVPTAAKAASGFQRGEDSITVTVDRASGVSAISVIGTLHA